LTWDQFQRLAFEGGWITVQVFVGAALFGTALSLWFGVLSLAPSRTLRIISRVYVETARGVSAIILLFWVAFALPIFLGFQVVSPMVSGIIALGTSMGGYGAEFVRGGIVSIPKGQIEASVSLSLTFTQRLRYVILPQAVVTILPPFGNLNIEVLKGTALVSLIALSDITFEAQKLRNSRIVLLGQGLTAPTTAMIFGTTIFIYFILSQIVALLFRRLEFRLGGRWYKVKV